MKILRFCPNPSPEDLRNIMHDVGCGLRTVYEALSRVREVNEKSAKGELVANSGKIGQKKKKRSKKKMPPPSPPGAIAKAALPSGKVPKITPRMSFERFCKYHSYPMYDGLYRWQYDWFKTVWPAEISLTLVSRDHGKSISHSNICQYVMSLGWDVLYLGWTTRRKEIAQFVYIYFERRNELVVDKTTSPFHFKTRLGTHFDTFSVKSKEVLGMHELGAQDRVILEGENEYLEDFVRESDNKLLLVIDDPIDGTFRKERHKEQELEDFYDSTIMPINPTKTMIVGTKKFKDDFFSYIEDKYEDSVVIFKSSPFLDPTDPRFDNEPDNPCNLLCPERWIWHEDPAYPKYLKLKELVRSGVPTSQLTEEERKLVRKHDLYKKKQAMNPYWWAAEYMQDPHPITGEIWEKVIYEQSFKGTAYYDLCCINIDRATTQKATSDYTGITVFFRERRLPDMRQNEKSRILVTHDLSQKIRITDLAEFIERFYRNLRREHGYNIKIQINVEKQGGGDDFCDLCEDAGYSFAGHIVRIHNTINKIIRITDNLGTPIDNGEVVFLIQLKDSELVYEILHCPYFNKIDALDSLAMGYFEQAKIPQSKVDNELIVSQLRAYREDIHSKGDPIKQFLSQKGSIQRGRRPIF